MNKDEGPFNKKYWTLKDDINSENMFNCVKKRKEAIEKLRLLYWEKVYDDYYTSNINEIINDSSLTKNEKELYLGELSKNDKGIEDYKEFFWCDFEGEECVDNSIKNLIGNVCDEVKTFGNMIDELINALLAKQSATWAQSLLNLVFTLKDDFLKYSDGSFDLNFKPFNDKGKLRIIQEIIKLKEPSNCEFTYGKCDEKCKKYINITSHPRNNGTKCPSSVIDCNPGEDKCPYTQVDCQESYSKCKIINDSNAPSNIKGKCSKKNIIYKNSAHGGQLCKNETYVRCNDGEGNCPSDCIGKFSNCASNCTKKYKITRNAKNGGKNCNYNNDQIVDCKGDKCIESIDCVGSWSNCDSNCEKTWIITTEKQGKGVSCRFRNGTKIKCTEDDDSKCKEVINKNCQGRWTTCDSNCKKGWIIEDKASGSGTCDYSENTKYDCNEGEGNCLISKDCVGRWTTCDENCKSKWELLEKEQGKNGRCDLIDGQEKSCVHGEGLCVIKDDNTYISSNESVISKNESNDDNLKIIILVSFLIILGFIAY